MSRTAELVFEGPVRGRHQEARRFASWRCARSYPNQTTERPSCLTAKSSAAMFEPYAQQDQARESFDCNLRDLGRTSIWSKISLAHGGERSPFDRLVEIAAYVLAVMK